MKRRHSVTLTAMAITGILLAATQSALNRKATEETPQKNILIAHARQQEKALIGRIEDSFTTVYLTLISIIQGVALSFLAEHAFTSKTPDTDQWLAYATCFVIIIVVWQEYALGAVTFTWIPSLLDALIPFTIGTVEFLLIDGARSNIATFLVRFLLFLGAGVVGYSNWLFHARHGADFNKVSYSALGSYVRFGTEAALTFFFISAGITFSHQKIGSPNERFCMILTLLIALVLLMHGIVHWTIPIRRIVAIHAAG